MAVEASTRLMGVIEGDEAGAVDCSRLGDADQRAVEGAARQRAAHSVVLARGKDQRQRRRALAQVGAGDLARLDRLPGAVEDVVRDLERDPEGEAERAEAAVAAAPEQAGSFEELRRLEGTALEVALDGRLRVVRLRTLQRLAAPERQGGRG